METKKRALGRGLEQLFNSENLDLDSMEKQIYETASKEEIVEINIDELRPNPYQPRKVFKDEALDELADSIKEHGVFQPIIVKKSIKGYEIIAGERRYRASKKAGLTKIPAIVRAFTDEQMMEIALLENLQRENLSAIEEAQAYKSMIDKLYLTQEELAKKVGKSRSHITNILGLLRLPNEVQQMVAEDKISMGHARVLSKLESNEKIVEIANKIVESKMPVRDLETLTTDTNLERRVKINRRSNESNGGYKYVEDLLRDKLDTKVKIKNNKIEISFSNVADLNRILDVLNVKE
jgi:ParB family chromosome partitioning protein